MSNRAPDFSSTFEIVDDQLEDAERRLAERRSKQNAEKIPAAKNPASKLRDAKPNTTPVDANEKPAEESSASKPIRRNQSKGEATKPALVKREVRRNLTLKVLEENETRFNQLFHRLQLAGDGRRKQELADEALGLLFQKYGRLKI